MTKFRSAEEMERLQEQFRTLGYLIPHGRTPWTKEWDGRRWWGCMRVCWGEDCWDTLKATGTVYVNYFAFQKMLFFTEDARLLKGWQLLFGRLRIEFAAVRLNGGDTA